MTFDELRLNGVYTNIKTGDPYRIIGQASHSEHDEELVIYVRADIGGRLWARPTSVFLDKFEPRANYRGTGGPSSAG